MKKIGKFLSLAILVMLTSACTQAQQNGSTMNVKIIKDQYALHSKLFNNVLEDINEDESNVRVNENVNSLKWIVGHTLDIQYNLAALLSIVNENPYANQFGFGKPFDPEGNYPSLEKMKSDWNAFAPKVEASIEALELSVLNSPAPFPLPYNEQTIRGLLAFQMHHLAYEIGQMGLYRKFLGKEAISYQ